MRKPVFCLLSLLSLTFPALAQDTAHPHLRNSDKTLESAPGKAVVALSVNFMREKPEFEAELGDQALMGTLVDVLEREDGWAKIKTAEPYTAWVDERGLVFMSDKEVTDYLEAPKYICVAELTHVREEPSLKSPVVSELVKGDLVRIMYKTVTHTRGSLTGYEEGRAVLKKKFVGVVLPSGKTGYVPSADMVVFYKWAKDRKALAGDEASLRKSLVDNALTYVSVPYMWGGTSFKGVDCSGFTRCVFFDYGIMLPRNASQQGRIGEPVNIFNASGAVDWSALLPGDLVFWGREATEDAPEKATHVGIYIGEGRFIHSSIAVRISSLNPASQEYYDRKPLCARRIVGLVDDPGSGVRSVFGMSSYIPR